MRPANLFGKTLAILVSLFGLAAVATALLSAWTLDRNLTEAYQSKGTAIATSIADSSVEVLLYRDVSTIQAMIDQFLEIRGVAYVFVVDGQGEIIAHTFEPGIPAEVLGLDGRQGDTTARRIQIEGQGEYIDVSARILAGKAGCVHVGMDRGVIQASIWSAVVEQIGLMSLIFLLSILAAYALVRKVAQPLDRLTAAANRLAHSAPPADTWEEPAPELLPIIPRTDEVGQLAQAFRHMALEVSARERALRQAHDALEARVRERTAELVQANEHLQAEIAERQRAAEEALAHQAQELARSNAELEQVAYVASHDLQEPLRKVQAFGDLLISTYRDALGEEGRDYLQRMQNASKRMQLLINDLLTYSRVTSQAKSFVEVDLARVAREVLSDLEARVRDTGGQVSIGDCPRLDADPMQMRQLLQNLIGNALKFHPEGEPPVVAVQGRVLPSGDGGHSEASSPHQRCEITVQDNGIGFEEKYLDRIFAPFQRLHGRGQYEGTGIGLAVCRKIVERHGGTITARSAPGQGSTFVVLLPLRQPKGEQPHG